MNRFMMAILLGSVCCFSFCRSAAATEPAETEPTETVETAETAEQKYDLRYLFTPGEFVRYEVSDESAVTTRTNQVKETVRNQSQIWRHYRVVSVDSEGSATLELMIDRVRLVAQFDDADPTIFDSADKNLQPVKFQSVLATIGKPTNRMQVNQLGELLSLQNLQGNQTAATGNDSKAVDQALNFLVVFPEHPVAIGETWKQSLEIEVPITNKLKEKVKLLRNYTLESVDDGIAQIQLTTVLATNIRDAAVKTRLMQQTPSGMVRFNMETRQLIYRELKVDDQVVGAFGPGTMVESQSLREEKLINIPEKSAAQAATPVSQTP